jgi:glycosyltransferase involved in cell wall biosynthesis
MGKFSKLSFIIPAYNCELTIEEAVKSCFEQNLKIPFEIVVVNDASTDKTEKILNLLKKRFENLVVKKNNINKGGAYTRNKCVEYSSGDLIFCLDSDNVLIKDSVQPLINLLKSTKSSVASFSHLKYFSGISKKKFLHVWKYKNTGGFCLLDDVIESGKVPISSGNYLFTRKAFDAVKGYPLGVGALDAWGFGFRLLVKGYKIVILPNSFYLHRLSNSSYWLRESKNNNHNISKLFIENKNIFDEKSKKILSSNEFKNNPFYYIDCQLLRLKESNRNSFVNKIKSLFFVLKHSFNSVLVNLKKYLVKLFLSGGSL